jgi:hypothetical protein
MGVDLDEGRGMAFVSDDFKTLEAGLPEGIVQEKGCWDVLIEGPEAVDTALMCLDEKTSLSMVRVKQNTAVNVVGSYRLFLAESGLWTDPSRVTMLWNGTRHF